MASKKATQTDRSAKPSALAGALIASMQGDQALGQAQARMEKAGQLLAQLRTRGEVYQERQDVLASEIQEREAQRRQLLESGKGLEAVEAELVTRRTELASVHEWNRRIEDQDIPQAAEELKLATRAVALEAGRIMAAHKPQVEADLLSLLSEVLQRAQDWREAKRAAWRELGINPNLVYGLPRTVVFLPDLAPELRDAFGTARPGSAY